VDPPARARQEHGGRAPAMRAALTRRGGSTAGRNQGSCGGVNRAILLFGYPGCGKGTQGKILAALPGFHHVAMGDILRGLTPANPLYAAVYERISKGNLVPDQLAMDLFANHVESLKLSSSDFVI